MNITAIIHGMTHQVVTATPEMSVAEAVRLLAERRIGAVPVLDGDEVVGIMSERDVLYCLAREGAAALERTVGEVMTAPAHTVEGAQSVLGALGLMTERRMRHLPVVEEGRMVGFVSIGDLVKYRMDRIEQDAQAMRDYIQSA
ncbi:MAG: CBS domain-containing protein [Sphingomonadaceae bacterium]|nr:CBS domain-containing protein [Sphingomonadaceae bacterium]